MQEATCSLKAPALIHHGWALQTSSDSEHRTEDALVPSPIPDASISDPQQSTDQSFGTVVSSLNRLSLSATDASSSGLPGPASLMTSAVTSGYSSWPTDSELFQSTGPTGLPAAVPSNLPTFAAPVSGIPGVNVNGLHSPFSTSATPPQSSAPRRAITGHAPMPPAAAETFGASGPTNGNRTYASWTNPAQTLNWLQSGRPGTLPTRFGPVHHGRSMSVQNINMTGSSSLSAIPPRKSPNQYASRGGGSSAGIFGGLPSGYNGQGPRAPFLPQVDQFGSRYGDVDEKALLAGLSQDVASSAGLEAQWLDLIRSAVQDQVRGLSGANCGNGWPFSQQQFDHSRQPVKNKVPLGLLDGSDASCLDKQFALAGCGGFAGSAGLAAAMSASLERPEVYSRKVFVGGLPPDIDEEEIMAAFRRFGPLVVDWPHKAESKSYFPPKGYCFLLFQEELSVQALVEACSVDDSKLYWCVSSPTMKDKPVQVRPWNLSDADFVMDGSQTLDPRKTVFVGGVPRPLRAVELAMIMGRLYGGVCYAGIDTDPELKYPKGAGRVAFSSQQSYIAAISARFVQLQHGDIDKRVEVKPYVLDDQICDECAGVHSGGKFAPFFCANVTCLQYYCEPCWARIHSAPGREFHKPLVKEGADRPRAMPFRWC